MSTNSSEFPPQVFYGHQHKPAMSQGKPHACYSQAGLSCTSHAMTEDRTEIIPLGKHAKEQQPRPWKQVGGHILLACKHLRYSRLKQVLLQHNKPCDTRSDWSWDNMMVRPKGWLHLHASVKENETGTCCKSEWLVWWRIWKLHNRLSRLLLPSWSDELLDEDQALILHEMAFLPHQNRPHHWYWPNTECLPFSWAILCYLWLYTVCTIYLLNIYCVCIIYLLTLTHWAYISSGRPRIQTSSRRYLVNQLTTLCFLIGWEAPSQGSAFYCWLL